MDGRLLVCWTKVLPPVCGRQDIVRRQAVWLAVVSQSLGVVILGWGLSIQAQKVRKEDTMKRLMCLSLLLVIWLAVPGVVYAAPVTEDVAEANALTEALGTLAVYAAVIAALAAGVEVLTDLVRPALGMERQPQALETLEHMKEWLPGTLKELGTDPQAQAQLEGYLTQLDKTVRDVTSAAQPDRIAQAVQKWALGAVRSVGAAAHEQLETKLQELAALLRDQFALQEGDVNRALDSAKQILDALQRGEPLEQSVQEFKKLLGNLNLDASQVDGAVAKAFEALSTLVGDEQLERELKKLLSGFGLQASEIDSAVATALQVLNGLKTAQGAQQVVKLASSLDSFGSLLDAVEAQRDDVIGVFRRLWRALRDWNGLGLTRRLFPGEERWDWIRTRSLLGALLYLLEKGWNLLWGKSEAGGQPTLLLMPGTVAQVLLNRDLVHQRREVSRQRQLRFVTVVVGMALAVALRIDSLELLKPLFGAHPPEALLADGKFLTLEQILEKLLGVSWAVQNWRGLGQWLLSWIAAATPGMLLSGLAASGGSAFWHDQLDRLRATKQTAEQVSALVAGLKGSGSQEE